MLERTSALWPSCLPRIYRRQVIAVFELLAKLGRFNHDAVTTMAAVLVAVVLMAYWILKT